jgi:hypothetical protein
MPIQSYLSKLGLSRLMPHMLVLSLVGAGSILMAWVGWLTWIDISQYSKDIGSIFFGSRTGEAISLGVGMTVLHYFLISLSLIGAGVVLFLKNRILAVRPELSLRTKAPKVDTPTSTPAYQTYNQINNQTNNESTELKSTTTKEETAAAREERFFSGCLHHFGYLSSRPTDSPIPQECILCQRLGDCMVATVYVNKLSD